MHNPNLYFCAQNNSSLDSALDWDQRVAYSRLFAGRVTVLCPWGKTLYPLLSTGLIQEDNKSSGNGWLIVDWDVKHKKTFIFREIRWKSPSGPVSLFHLHILMLNTFPSNQVNCCLLSHMLMFLWFSILQTIWTQIRLLLRSSLFRVHSVCFHGKSILECIGIHAADVVSRPHFQGKRNGSIGGTASQ